MRVRTWRRGRGLGWPIFLVSIVEVIVYKYKREFTKRVLMSVATGYSQDRTGEADTERKSEKRVRST